MSQFIELYNLISETLKDTPYKVISKISGDDFYERYLREVIEDALKVINDTKE